MSIDQITLAAALWLLLIVPACDQQQDDQLYYEEAGAGETILFIHGAQEDYRVFLPQLAALQDRYRVITYSRRYNHPRPQTYTPGTDYSPITEARELATLIRSLDVDRLHLVGHSFGGLIALAYTHAHPDMVESLILSEPPLLRLPGCASWHQQAQEGLIDAVAQAFATQDTTLIMKALFEFFAGADIQEHVPPEVLKSLKANLTEMQAIVHSEDPFPALSTDLAPPVMLVTSGNTMPMLTCVNEVLVQRWPEAKHVHIENAGHEMWMTHPEVLAQFLGDFISGIKDDVRIE
ncbi:MAG: alpha/beta hydrolase, partial [Saprospiraceae bacterium]|nr:alpha/beta hydrolase [Saprospiraceae bacterium]